MLTLRTNREAAWLDLPDTGVRVKAPPLDVAGLRAAEYCALKAGSAARDALGVADDQEPTDVQVGAIEGAYAQARIRALADRITEWEGLVGEDGEVLPITPEALDAFAAHPKAGPAFLRAYERPALAVIAEAGNSANSSGGATGEGQNTAPDAAIGAPPAPASSTRPARRREQRSKPR